MGLKPINRICPRCGNGNYMRIIDGKNVGKLNVKCINCNSYYNYDELLKGDNRKPLNGTDGRTMDDLISRATLLRGNAKNVRKTIHLKMGVDIHELIQELKWYRKNEIPDIQPEYLDDIITVLKAQEPVEPTEPDEDNTRYCGACGSPVGYEVLEPPGLDYIQYNYCPICGRAVKWDA